MDQLLAMRLDSRSSLYDSALFNKLAKLGRDYVTAGTSVLDYFIPDFDIANDMVNCYASGKKEDFEKDRLHPDRFVHPMSATEITTLATFLSQILFGGETTRKVEPRKPDDEAKADIVNELLAWNDAQQPTYNQGYFWIWDALTFNRGVMYDRWKDTYEVELEPVEYELPYEAPIDPVTKKKVKKPRDWKGETATRFRKKRTKVGGFAKVENLSPYDFICDPTYPVARFQDGRFAGHRVILTWQELKRRSELDPSDYEYVLPAVVEKLKNSKAKKTPGMSGGTPQNNLSRTAYERGRRSQPVTPMTDSGKIDKEDGGIVECYCLQIRARPKTYDIFDDEEDELIEVLGAGESDLLSVNILANKHDSYAYAIGEARPNAHQQFSPSWTLILKGPQNFVDYLNLRRQESLARTSGNIFIGDPSLVDFDAFTNPKKDGLFIPLTPAGAESGKPINQIIQQVPVNDTTANFHEEMLAWIKTAEDTTGAHASTQGKTDDPSQTATQFAGTQQMSTGRISTIARLLSASALVPQTQRIISNLQQWLPPTMTIRITGEHEQFDPDKPQQKFLNVIRDKSELSDGTMTDEEGATIPRDPALDAGIPDIQGQFDVVVHDGSLPGADEKKIAAMSRALDAYSTNPALAAAFDQTKPGAINAVKLFQKLLKYSGFPSGGLLITAQEAQANAVAQLQAQGGGMGMPSTAGVPPGPPTPPEAPAGAIAPIPSAAPPQVRPQNAGLTAPV